MKEIYQKPSGIMPNNFKYDKIIQFDGRDYTIATKNGKSGLINLRGKSITEFIYDDLSDEFPFDMGYDLGWVNFDNKSDKYCKMRLNNKWGLLDKNGNIIVDFNYLNPVKEWGENFIITIEKEKNVCKSFIMDKNKNIHLELNFDNIYPFNQCAIVEKSCKFGIINDKLQLVVDFEYDYLGGSSENKYIDACIDNKWGIIDIEGNLILDFIFDNVTVEKVNDKYIFRVELDNKFALLSEEGERIV